MLVGLVALTSACSSGPAAPAATAAPVIQAVGSGPLVVSGAQAGSAIALQPAQPLQIELASDAASVSGGYEWTLIGSDPAVLTAGMPRFERASRDINAFESAGTTIWRFTPKASGRTTLEFALRKPRTLAAPLETVRYEVIVR